MSRVPELFVPERDQSARESGLVYIEDLTLSGLMVALKANCAPQGLGFLNARPVAPEEVNTLHRDLVTGIAEVTQGGGTSHSNDNPDISISKDYDGKLKVSADYWDGRPFKTRFVAGENLDRTLLTGFDPFDPWGFDRDQGPGIAQKVVDDLRGTGNPLSLEVLMNEKGRIFDRAKEAQGMIDPDFEPRLFVALQSSLQGVRGLVER